MAATASTKEFVPDTTSLTELAEASQHCRGCELFEDATQTVFGRGPASSKLMLVGEQPGDVEDQRGVPFVGPAGKVLLQALADVGITPGTVYVTNAVKHFRWRVDPKGSKRRIHQTPSAGNIRACRPWLSAELAAVKPRLVVLLGATAAKSLLGPSFKLTANRGQILDTEFEGRELTVLATIHPSAVLRAPDRDEARAGLVADLTVAAEFLT
jgi:uracil-DNA glycosylase family protein